MRRFLVAGPVHAVDQQDVLPAVAIVIEEGAAGAQRFRQELAAEGAAVVMEVEAGGLGDIGETETEIRACRLRCERVQARQR